MLRHIHSTSKTKIQKAWQKAQVVVGYDSSEWRKDADGHWIRYSDYGQRGARHGWELARAFSRSAYPSGTPVHCASGTGAMRQNTGQKSWWSMLMGWVVSL